MIKYKVLIIIKNNYFVYFEKKKLILSIKYYYKRINFWDRYKEVTTCKIKKKKWRYEIL